VLRKEVVVNTSSVRSLVKKTNDVAILTERLAASLITQRHILIKMSSEMSTAMASRPGTSGGAGNPMAGSGDDTGATAVVSSATAGAPPVTEESQIQAAQWVLELKRDLVKWLVETFINATCTADIWLPISDVNNFLCDWVVRRISVTPREAVKMLEKRWRLPVRRKRVRLAETAATRDAAAAAQRTTDPRLQPTSLTKDGTVAYRYLHRAISHLYQRVGAKAVSAFASFVNEKLNKGTLRRLRGTKTKYEVFFNRRDATKLLNDNFFLNDNTCRSGLVRALAAVFASFNALESFSESGETPTDSRVVVCRLGYFALVSTKVRAHLKVRAAAKSRGADDGGVTDEDNNEQVEEDNDDDRSRGGDDGESDGDEEATGGHGKMAAAEALNGGHRPEWVDELPIVDGILRPQGAGPVNGLRIVDSLQGSRLDTFRSPPAAPPSSDNPPPPTPGVVGGLAGAARRGAGACLLPAAIGHRDGLPPREPANEEDDSDEWSTADDAEDPPRRRRRTTEEGREAAARRAAARILMDHDA